MKIFDELTENEIISVTTEQGVLSESKKLQDSLPYYFYTVKSNILLYLKLALGDKAKKGEKTPIPEHRCSYVDGDLLYMIRLDGDSISYSQLKNEWYFASNSRFNDVRVKISEEEYINALFGLFGRLFGIYFYFPTIAKCILKNKKK